MLEPESNSELIQGQLITYQNILSTKLSNEELQELLSQQKELLQLEKHLESLQISEQLTQIVHNPSRNN